MTDYDMLVFDVNETLLDLSALKPVLAHELGPEIPMGEWFARLLHRSLVSNHLGRYQSFGELGGEVLTALAASRGVGVSAEAVDRVMTAMTDLPPHPDVIPGLRDLAESGIRIVALTNGSADALAAQLANAGIAEFFDGQMSVEAVRRFKPAPEVYLHAAAVSGVDIDRMLLVAAHDWDVAGAQSVGAGGCFVARQPWGIPTVSPTYTIDDLRALRGMLAGESDEETTGWTKGG